MEIQICQPLEHWHSVAGSSGIPVRQYCFVRDSCKAVLFRPGTIRADASHNKSYNEQLPVSDSCYRIFRQSEQLGLEIVIFCPYIHKHVAISSTRKCQRTCRSNVQFSEVKVFMLNFSQGLAISRAEENRSMMTKHDCQTGQMMHNAAIKQNEEYRLSQYDEKYSMSESCGSSQPAKLDVSGKGKSRDIIIINNGEGFSNAPSASGIIRCCQHKSTEEKEKVLRDWLFQMRIALRNKLGPDFELLNSDPVLGADGKYTFEPWLDITQTSQFKMLAKHC